MPCAAPCNRLPCSQRCPKSLLCGHQCPSLCGEICPSGYCQICSDKQDHRVDMLEFKSFGEIDLNSTPIVVLSCGHFFTAETLDGHMGMARVYEMNREREFIGLRDISGDLVQNISQCPDCQCPVRQFATQRYNRVINRAVIDEMSKRFLVGGKTRLEELLGKAHALELSSEKSREELLELVEGVGTDLNPVQSLGIIDELEDRSKKFNKLAIDVASFIKKITAQDQPVRTLYDATVKALRARRSISESMEKLAINEIPILSRDRRVILGSQVVQIKVQFIKLADRLMIGQKLGPILKNSTGLSIPGGDAVQLATDFFKSCEECIADCQEENLPKLNTETRLYYSRIARLYQSYTSATKSPGIRQAARYVECAKQYLNEAQTLCQLGFQNADGLQLAVEEILHLLGKEWYEPMSATELATVKAAMLSGKDGLATHSGHWYNCQNGHAVSFFAPISRSSLSLTETISLRWASAGCQWSKRGAPSAVPPLAGTITSPQPG